MGEYSVYTNTELEEELGILKAEYEAVQEVVIENYQKMLNLAAKYGEVEDILNTRMGKKKEE